MAKFCTNCGSKLNEDEDVCLNCGKKVKKNKSDNTNVSTEQNNPYVLTGFILGLISMFCINLFGVVGLLALIFSSIGLSKINKTNQPGRWMAITGIVLGVIGLVVGIYLTLS